MSSAAARVNGAALSSLVSQSSSSAASSTIRYVPIDPAAIDACAALGYHSFHAFSLTCNQAPEFPSMQAYRDAILNELDQDSTFHLMAVKRDAADGAVDRRGRSEYWVDGVGDVLGSVLMSCSAEVAAIGPISVAPSTQSRGVGRKAAKAGFRSVRLCNVVANVTAFSLYNSLGFSACDYMMHIKGRIAPQHQQRLAADMQAAAVTVRPMAESDIADCDRLQLATTAYSRYHSILHSFRSQLSQRLLSAQQQQEQHKTPLPGLGEPQHTCFVAVDSQQRLLGYTDGYDVDKHTVATEEAVVSWLYARLCTELEEAGTQHGDGSPDLHVLTQRFPSLLNRMLALGCRSVRQICIMTHGEYVAPRRHVYCFPARDTRVLTDRGLLFLDQIEWAQWNGDTVRFGCYDVQSKALLYCKGELVFPQQPPSSLVEFNSDGEAARWAQGNGDYGTEGVLEDNPNSPHVHLRVTSEHDMFVQLDRRSGHGAAWSSTTGGCDPSSGKQPPAVLEPRRKVSAQHLLSTDPRDYFSMLACAEAGYAPQATSWRRAVRRDLHLDDTQFAAFLELLGFWLGDGSLDYGQVAGAARGCVAFSRVKQTDLAWLRSAFEAAGLKEDEHWLSSSGIETTLFITEPAWFAFFDKGFGGKKVKHRQSAKHLPFWTLQELPAVEMRLLISGLHRAAGEFAAAENVIYTSCPFFRDQLVQALLHCGYSAWAGLKCRKGAIRGYDLYDQSKDTKTYSVSFFAALSAEEKVKYWPIVATADAWKVSWAELDHARDSPAAGSCWPSMSRRQCVTRVPYDAERDGRTWCVKVQHDDHLIIAQRAHRVMGHIVTKQSRPIIVGNCPSIMW